MSDDPIKMLEDLRKIIKNGFFTRRENIFKQLGIIYELLSKDEIDWDSVQTQSEVLDMITHRASDDIKILKNLHSLKWDEATKTYRFPQGE